MSEVQRGQWSVGPARLDDEDLAADRWADDLVAQRLPGVRRYCERWATTLSALFALLGAATLLSSDSAVRALAPPWTQLYGVCVAVALGAAALATYTAHRAFGERLVTLPADVAGRRQALDDLVVAALADRRRSQQVALVALTALAAAFALRWYAPLG
jgi:hypothetical protein